MEGISPSRFRSAFEETEYLLLKQVNMNWGRVNLGAKTFQETFQRHVLAFKWMQERFLVKLWGRDWADYSSWGDLQKCISVADEKLE